MRMMMQFTIPVEAGNHAAISGGLGATFQRILEALRPEAAYFGTGTTGERGGFIVFDMEDPSRMPTIAEPLFLNYHANVRLFPVMNAEDLAKGISALEASHGAA